MASHGIMHAGGLACPSEWKFTCGAQCCWLVAAYRRLGAMGGRLSCWLCVAIVSIVA